MQIWSWTTCSSIQILQVNYNFNMVAIDNYTPRQVGIVPIFSSYIAHRRDIIVARSRFDKEKAERRLHIVEGLIRVISILDEVIALIRASDNKADAKENLKVSYVSRKSKQKLLSLCNCTVWQIRISWPWKKSMPASRSKSRPWQPSLGMNGLCLTSWRRNCVKSRNSLAIRGVVSCGRHC